MCLGADTRATAGPIVADKNCEKVCMVDINADTRFTTLLPRSVAVVLVLPLILSELPL